MTASIGKPTLVVMGVSGCGKTQTSRALAAELGVRYIEADDFHPAENLAQMRVGLPLTDAQRIGWLQALGGEMRQAVDDGCGFVLACSALRRRYRQVLRAAVPGLRFVHLVVDPETARQRVGARVGHFMPGSLVDSQFATLESPAGEPGVLSVDTRQPREVVRRRIIDWLRMSTEGSMQPARPARPDGR